MEANEAGFDWLKDEPDMEIVAIYVGGAEDEEGTENVRGDHVVV